MIALRLDGPVATLSLAGAGEDPARLAHDDWADLRHALDQARQDDSLEVLVLAGASASVFCLGADVADLRVRHGAGASREYVELTRGVIGELADFPAPSVAAVRGACSGAGCTLALACDLRIGDSSSSFGFPSARLGLVYPELGCVLLTETVGPSRAKQLLYTACTVDALDARAMGLLNQLSLPEEFEAQLELLLASITSLAGSSHRAHKRHVAQALRRPPTGTVASGEELAAYESASFDEGTSAALERRPPSFRAH